MTLVRAFLGYVSLNFPHFKHIKKAFARVNDEAAICQVIESSFPASQQASLLLCCQLACLSEQPGVPVPEGRKPGSKQARRTTGVKGGTRRVRAKVAISARTLDDR